MNPTMKKLAVLTCCGAMLALAGCGGGKKEDKDSRKRTEQKPYHDSRGMAVYKQLQLASESIDQIMQEQRLLETRLDVAKRAIKGLTDQIEKDPSIALMLADMGTTSGRIGQIARDEYVARQKGREAAKDGKSKAETSTLTTLIFFVFLVIVIIYVVKLWRKRDEAPLTPEDRTPAPSSSSVDSTSTPTPYTYPSQPVYQPGGGTMIHTPTPRTDGEGGEQTDVSPPPA